MNLFAYLIAFLEGFSTLAVEILAIRKATPIVGSSVVLTGIVLGVILLALSSGYYFGGYLSAKLSREQIKKLLQFNLLFAGVFYALVTFSLAEITLTYFIEITGNYLFALFLFAAILLFLPVFVASQTLPLLTEYLEDTKKGLAAGKILFFSTVGSFFGSILPPVFLFEKIGVEKTVFVVAFLLVICSLLIAWERKRKPDILSLFVGWILAIGIITPRTHTCIYAFDSAYQNICVYDTENSGKKYRIFSLNDGYSSGIDLATGKSFFRYVQEAMRISKTLHIEKILVLGWAGFTYPEEIAEETQVQKIDVVDVDGSVFEIAEKYFFERPLSQKISFHPISGRYFINQAVQDNARYDLAFVDVYFGKFTIPNEFLTQEFFEDLGKITTNHNILFNMILDTDLASDFATNIFTTLDSTYGAIYYKKTSADGELGFSNFIVTPMPLEGYLQWAGEKGSIYTDDRGTYETDKEKMFFRGE